MPADNKILVVYFSFSGITRSVATKIATNLDATTVEIKPLQKGMFGLFMKTLFGLPAKLQKFGANSAEFDLVIIATPIWSAKIPSPVRAYLATVSDQCDVAFVCTQNSEGATDVLKCMQKLTMKTSANTLILSKTDLDEETIADDLISRFCSDCLTTLEDRKKMPSHLLRSAVDEKSTPITA